jgi:glucosyl-3-phosphoglycerate synthase
MADFFQNGVIATLQKLRDRPVEEIEAELRRFSERQKIVLLLPALYSEFEGPAMPQIVEELKEVDYLHRIILSLDRADEQQFEQVKGMMSGLRADVSIIWHDGPRIQSMFDQLVANGFEIGEQGKGRGVWLSMGLALYDEEVHTVALHDCDIVNYHREMLARLVYPLAHPGTDFEYSKGFYARVDDRLFGRVTRLFFTPVIRALRQLTHHDPFLVYLDSFRYPLSGECAFIRSLAKSIRISPNWGLEMSMLGEVYERTTVERVCQVEIADAYHHKHQPLSRDDPERGLARMATDIAKTLFGIMAQGGLVLSRALFDTLFASYQRHARMAIERYNALAMLNGLEYDRHEEIEAVESFAENLRLAELRFREDPIGEQPLASWVRVRAGIPDFSRSLAEAVELDNSERAMAVPFAG